MSTTNNGKLKNLLVNKDCSIKETMRVIDQGGLGLAFVVGQGDKIVGLATDGDIRSAILKGVDVEQGISEIMNKNPLVIKKGEIYRLSGESANQKDIEKKMPVAGSIKIPIINDNKEIIDIDFIYSHRISEDKKGISNNAVKKVLVIGGVGYLGSVLSKKLLDKGYKVRALDIVNYNDQGLKELSQNKNFEFIKGDIRNTSDVVEAIKGADAVIHLAGIVGDPACAKDSEETLEINYLATKGIIDACKYFQINRLIFASTCSVYGQSPLPDDKLTEESPFNPVSLYARTKIECENSILEAMDGNFSPTILRMATLYGLSPNMRFDLVANLLTAKAAFDKEITIFGGGQWRPWLHLEDAAEAYIKCLESPIERIKGEIFNVLSENYKMIDLGKIINSVYPEAEIKITDNSDDKRNYNVSGEKIKKTLDYQPEKRIADGVNEIKKSIDTGLINNYKDAKYRR